MFYILTNFQNGKTSHFSVFLFSYLKKINKYLDKKTLKNCEQQVYKSIIKVIVTWYIWQI